MVQTKIWVICKNYLFYSRGKQKSFREIFGAGLLILNSHMPIYNINDFDKGTG